MKLDEEEEPQALSPMEDEEDEEEEQQQQDDKEEEHETKPRKHKKSKKHDKIEPTIQLVPEEEKTIKARIQIVPEQPDKSTPLIGYFTSGFDPLTYKSRKNVSVQHTKVGLFRNSNKPNRVQLVVTPNESNVEYLGSSYDGEAANRQPCTYALGVLDKEFGTLKLVPITANKIFRMEPRVADYVENEPSGSVKELSAEERALKQKELVIAFGTKQSQTKAKKKDALNQKEDSNLKEELDQKIKDVTLNKEALESATAPAARNIPPYNCAATTPELAFPLDKIILSGDWNYLVDVWGIKSEEAPDTYPRFVRSRFRKLAEIQDVEEQRKLAGILSYITHLIKFKDTHSMDGKFASKDSNLPAILRSRFFKLFTDSESTSRLSEDKCTLLISYVCVLTLFADQFKSDLADIAKDLRRSTIDVRKHFEHLGCKFVREGRVPLATLPVPLEFPVSTRGKRKRRN